MNESWLNKLILKSDTITILKAGVSCKQCLKQLFHMWYGCPHRWACLSPCLAVHSHCCHHHPGSAKSYCIHLHLASKCSGSCSGNFGAWKIIVVSKAQFPQGVIIDWQHHQYSIAVYKKFFHVIQFWDTRLIRPLIIQISNMIIYACTADCV